MHFSSSSSSLQPPSLSMPRAMEAITLLISRGWGMSCGGPAGAGPPPLSCLAIPVGLPVGTSPGISFEPLPLGRPPVFFLTQCPKATWEKLPKGKGLALVLTYIRSIGENPSSPDYGSHLLQVNSKGTRGKTPKATLIAL